MTLYALEDLRSDALGGLVAGVVAGVVAILPYMATRRHENRVDKRDMATILHSEVSRIARGHNEENTRRKKPSTLVYEGLLSSGNIKFFSVEMQEDLNSLYYGFADHPLSVDGLRASIVTEREEIINCNSKRRHFLVPC